jgi:hypothetical protein
MLKSIFNYFLRIDWHVLLPITINTMFHPPPPPSPTFMTKSLETTEISAWKQKMCRKKLRFKARNVYLEAKRLLRQNIHCNTSCSNSTTHHLSLRGYMFTQEVVHFFIFTLKDHVYKLSLINNHFV